MYFDTHAHLDDPALFEELDLVLENMNLAKVSRVLVPAVSPDHWEDLLDLRKHAPIYLALGVHPSEVKLDWQLTRLESLLAEEKVLAMGEIGLDYYHSKDHKERQQELFYEQLKMAKKHHLPVLIHNRDAHQDVRALLDEVDNYEDGVVFHAYSGSAEMAKIDVKKGAYISLAGPVTFRNARVPKEVAEVVPLAHLLIETDAPYLSPHPFRGKRNEPARVVLVAEEIARIKGLSVEEVAHATFDNASRVLGL